MSNIQDTQYITIKKDAKGDIGFYVGGKKVTKYNGVDIYVGDGSFSVDGHNMLNFLQNTFAAMQNTIPDIEEFHIGAFATIGEKNKSGDPSGEQGPNVWCRIKKKNSPASAWVFREKYDDNYAACVGAYACARGLGEDEAFCKAVLGVNKLRSPYATDNSKNDPSKVQDQMNTATGRVKYRMSKTGQLEQVNLEHVIVPER